MLDFVSVLLMICGIMIPCSVFGPYRKYILKHHTGKAEETLMEDIVFSFGFTYIALVPIGLILLLFGETLLAC